MKKLLLLFCLCIVHSGSTSAQGFPPGEFSTEFNSFVAICNDAFHGSLPDEVVILLTQSGTFMRMVGTLNAKYVSYDDHGSVSSAQDLWETGTHRNGVFTSGKFIGRRVLHCRSGTGSRFVPADDIENSYGADENSYGADLIELKRPGSKGNQRIGEWIERIAHETTHCHRYVTRQAGSGNTMLARIRTAIAEEVTTLGIEKKIVDEATKGRLSDYTPTTRPASPARVQRDMFPSTLKRTYLEEFVLGELIYDAVRAESLTPALIGEQNSRVDALSLKDQVKIDSTRIIYFDTALGFWNTFKSRYAELRLIQRIIDQQWNEFERGTPDDEDAKEKMLQEHARKFFGGIVSYLPKPS